MGRIFHFIGLGIALLYILLILFGTKQMERRIFGKYETS